MPDTLEPSGLRAALTTPLYRPRLRDTPLRDLIRFRRTGRLAWRSRLEAAALPEELKQAIIRLVKRTRLWRLEKAEVADELIAHFADGIARGETAQALLEDFGDIDAVAKLIRRAKRRNRPWVWHAWRWSFRLLVLLIGFYVFAFIRFAVGKPSIRIDYVGQLNAAITSVPKQDRAWPLYREALLSFEANNAALDRFYAELPDPVAAARDEASSRVLNEVTPTDAEWPQLVAWCNENQASISLVRAASAKRAFGFVLGRGNDADDPALKWDFSHDAKGGPLSQGALAGSLYVVPVPYLNRMRVLSDVLKADARVATHAGDGQRAIADILAIIGMADQLDLPILIEQHMRTSLYERALATMEAILADRPTLLDDARLVDLAHRVARVGGEAPNSLLDLSGERKTFLDFIQRFYTDDGNGGGRLASVVMDLGTMDVYFYGWSHGTLGGIPRKQPEWDEKAALALGAAGVSIVSARDEVVAEYDRLMAKAEARLARPLRESSGPGTPSVRDEVMAIVQSPTRFVRLMPVTSLTPSVDRIAERAEHVLGRREGLLVGIALELYRRRHDGRYPSTLRELVPTFLPEVPADRISGKPVSYRIIDGHPDIYSVGEDRDDDGGRAWQMQDVGPIREAVARWPVGSEANERAKDGDWILFDARPGASRE